ncbi:hypothetical protein [Thalassomonas sp. M1454]|uniref:hypothetical protein n=1 Tax=Thalassomonas sp. M1454 TaxID=2594477 RepID=UPI00163DA838|nr:hypothetical protein [Thalassomonas sp. M1454]
MKPKEILASATRETQLLVGEILKIEKSYKHYQNTIESKEKEIAEKIKAVIEGKVK